MNLRKLLTFALLTAFATAGFANTQRRGFAVVVDKASYEHCREAVESYAQATREQGWDSFVSAEDWDSPEQLRDSIRAWYSSKNLAGVVFIGDIPVPMIRKAQHLTSAFKMDETSPMRDSSVPSDRFYDDFDLAFDFIARDSVETNFFYYNLSPYGAQSIDCDIFSGRIKPSSHYRDKYEELDAYLRKVVRLKESDKGNRLDRLASYTGAGSFSDCMIAWKDECVTLEEQIPDAFEDIDGAKFFVFYQYPYIKDTLLKVAGDDSLDLFLFHHHGTPERQWIQESPSAEDDDTAYAKAKLMARKMVRNHVRFGETPQEAMAYVLEKYPDIDSTWVCDSFDPEVVAADSLEDLRLGILLDDVHAAKPNVRFSIFDACYNADFRENDFIANRYIMESGDAVAACGNSVNVLQDKHSSHLLGLLTKGWSVGQWHQKTAILESHIIGDPTWTFAPSTQGSIDEKALELNDMDSEELLAEYRKSKNYMYRLEVLKSLLRYDTAASHEAMREALDDPYEYIRRKAATFLCMRGDPEDVEIVADCYFNNLNAKRIAFNIESNSAFWSDSLFINACRQRDGFVYVKGADYQSFAPTRMMQGGEKAMESAIDLKGYFAKSLDDRGSERKGRLSMLSGLRNMPYPQYAGKLVEIVRDEGEPLSVRVTAAEVLGWYGFAYNRAEIVSSLGSNLDSLPSEVRNECIKTLKRLERREQ